MLLDIIFALVFFGLGSLQGWCMAHRNFRKNLGPAFELVEFYHTLSSELKEEMHELIEEGMKADAQRDK